MKQTIIIDERVQTALSRIRQGSVSKLIILLLYKYINKYINDLEDDVIIEITGRHNKG